MKRLWIIDRLCASLTAARDGWCRLCTPQPQTPYRCMTILGEQSLDHEHVARADSAPRSPAGEATRTGLSSARGSR
jgi:hypothetical protein